MTITDPAPNMELIEDILDTIKNDPKHWNQGAWVSDLDGDPVAPDVLATDTEGRPFIPVDCGTAMCFAGWAVHKTGGLFLSDEYVLYDRAVDTDVDGESDVVGFTVWVEDGEEPDGERMVDVLGIPVWLRAKKLLGLTSGERLNLFDGNNGLEQIEEVVADIRDRATATTTEGAPA